MGGRRPPRLSADCYRGFGRYFLTICAADRRAVFTSEASVEPVRSALLRTSADYRFEIPAYCFMWDHVHGLFESTTSDCDFLKFANMFKQRTAFRSASAGGGKLWQEGYFDRVLRRDEATLDVIAYILTNPVTAGLCREPRDYPYSGSTLYSLDEICDAIAQRSRRWRP